MAQTNLRGFNYFRGQHLFARRRVRFVSSVWRVRIAQSDEDLVNLRRGQVYLAKELHAISTSAEPRRPVGKFAIASTSLSTLTHDRYLHQLNSPTVQQTPQ